MDMIYEQGTSIEISRSNNDLNFAKDGVKEAVAYICVCNGKRTVEECLLNL